MSNPILDKIRALLAKAEATEYTSEAEAFFAKAEALMAKHAIDEALVWAEKIGAERDKVTSVVINTGTAYSNMKGALVGTIARHYNSKPVMTGKGLVTCVGFKSDLEAVEILTTSLLLQMERAMVRDCPKFNSPGQSKSWRNSFFAGFVSKIESRLSEQRAQDRATERESGNSSVALVLVDRKKEVDAEFRTLFPRVRSTRSSYRNNGGAEAGSRAGANASLNRGAVGGARGALGR